MKQWLYDFLVRLSTWLKPAGPIEPTPLTPPQIYALGLWDCDPKMPRDLTVGDLVKEMAWTEEPVRSAGKLNTFQT